MELIGFVYRGYCCCTLNCMHFGGSYFGCCCDNTSKCAELYWGACLPCRCAGSIAFCPIGALMDLLYLPCHCYGRESWLRCMQEWCGCQCLPRTRNQEAWLIYFPHNYENPIATCGELLYVMYCVHTNPLGHEISHCTKCKDCPCMDQCCQNRVSTAAPTVPVAPTRPPSISISSTATSPPSVSQSQVLVVVAPMTRE